MIREETVGLMENQEPGIEMNQCIRRRHMEHPVWFQNCKEQRLWGTIEMKLKKKDKLPVKMYWFLPIQSVPSLYSHYL